MLKVVRSGTEFYFDEERMIVVDSGGNSVAPAYDTQEDVAKAIQAEFYGNKEIEKNAEEFLRNCESKQFVEERARIHGGMKYVRFQKGVQRVVLEVNKPNINALVFSAVMEKLWGVTDAADQIKEQIRYTEKANAIFESTVI